MAHKEHLNTFSARAKNCNVTHKTVCQRHRSKMRHRSGLGTKMVYVLLYHCAQIVGKFSDCMCQKSNLFYDEVDKSFAFKGMK